MKKAISLEQSGSNFRKFTKGELLALKLLSNSFGYGTKGRTELLGNMPRINHRIGISLCRRGLVHYSPGYFTTIALTKEGKALFNDPNTGIPTELFRKMFSELYRGEVVHTQDTKKVHVKRAKEAKTASQILDDMVGDDKELRIMIEEERKLLLNKYWNVVTET